MKLTEAAVDFAKAHIEAYYDSDFLPKPPEYEALWARWNDTKKFVLQSNVEKLPAGPATILLAPKAWRGFRIVHQIDPLSAIIYTALTYEIASRVESSRLPPSVVASYRIAVNGKSFFGQGNGYNIYAERCAELASRHSYVLVADISDYYNSLYLHRLNNAIATADPSLEPWAKTIEHFLLRLNAKASQGIPVGPAASIVMSECLLNDIDRFISNERLSHVRYVDDFRVFADSREKLEHFLEKFVRYLYEPHRLQLAWHKTEILSADQYRDRYLLTPDRVERGELLEVLRELSDYGDAYTEDDAELLATKFLGPDDPLPPAPPKGSGFATMALYALARSEGEQKKEVRREALRRLLHKACAGDSLDLGLARRVIRHCRSMRLPDLWREVIGNLSRLTPVMPDVCLYLDAVSTPDRLSDIASRLSFAIDSGTSNWSSFVHHWLGWYIAGHAALADAPELRSYFDRFAPEQWKARAAVAMKNRTWVRARRTGLSQMGAAERRAVLMASRILPRDERKPWLESYNASTSDFLEQQIVAWALELP